MVDLLYRAIYWVAEMHDHILNINNAGGWYFDDKQLHFIVIGLLGMMMIFVTYPIFKLLASTGHTMVIFRYRDRPVVFRNRQNGH